MQVAVPERSQDQKLTALARANETRIYRSGVKADIRAGLLTVEDVLRCGDRMLAGMKVVDVLAAQSRYGPVRAASVMRRAGASLSKTVAGLTDRQRDEIVRAL